MQDKFQDLGDFDGTAWDDTSWRNTNAASQYGVWHGGGITYHVVLDTGTCTYTGAEVKEQWILV